MDSSLAAKAVKKQKIRRIWTVAGILALVTIIEFALAFTWPDTWSQLTLNVLFLLLTLLKAFYIVAEFMHLKHEVKKLAWSIVGPLALIVWLVVALISEADAISETIVRFWG